MVPGWKVLISLVDKIFIFSLLSSWFHYLIICYMCYEVTFDMVNTETGEIVSKNRKKTITTELEVTPLCLTDWVDSLYRGLRSGVPLSLTITAIKFEPSKQFDLF